MIERIKSFFYRAKHFDEVLNQAEEAQNKAKFWKINSSRHFDQHTQESNKKLKSEIWHLRERAKGRRKIVGNRKLSGSWILLTNRNLK